MGEFFDNQYARSRPSKRNSARLEIGSCYKHLLSGEVYVIRSIGKGYAHSKTGKLSPNVMRVLMEPVLRHGALIKEQVRYMESDHWQRLGILRQEKINGRSVDVFDDHGSITPLATILDQNDGKAAYVGI